MSEVQGQVVVVMPLEYRVQRWEEGAGVWNDMGMSFDSIATAAVTARSYFRAGELKQLLIREPGDGWMVVWQGKQVPKWLGLVAE